MLFIIESAAAMARLSASVSSRTYPGSSFCAAPETPAGHTKERITAKAGMIRKNFIKQIGLAYFFKQINMSEV